MGRPGRERERLVSEPLQLENRIENLLCLSGLCLYGITGFRPRLKKAAERLEALRSFAGMPLPGKTMAELRRLMGRDGLLSAQLHENQAERMIQHLARIVGLGLESATVLVREMFCRPFRDRRAVASFAGLTGTPFCSGGIEREQGIGKNGNARVRRIVIQLAWRWLRFQPHSALAQWFAARTGGAKGRIRTIMIVALARKLLVVLWRYAG